MVALLLLSFLAQTSTTWPNKSQQLRSVTVVEQSLLESMNWHLSIHTKLMLIFRNSTKNSLHWSWLENTLKCSKMKHQPSASLLANLYCERIPTQNIKVHLKCCCFHNQLNNIILIWCRKELKKQWMTN